MGTSTMYGDQDLAGGPGPDDGFAGESDADGCPERSGTHLRVNRGLLRLLSIHVTQVTPLQIHPGGLPLDPGATEMAIAEHGRSLYRVTAGPAG